MLARGAIRFGPLTAVVLLALIMVAPAKGNHSTPATYAGGAASGGTVEFDVSADGNSVTRFAVKDVQTSCGTVSSQMTGNIPISNHAFSQSSGPLRFSGSFPLTQQAQGDLSVQIYGFPSCTSDPVAWNASTPTPPPPPETGTPTPAGSSYASCVKKENATFKKERKGAKRAKARATTKAQKRRARKRLKKAIRKRKRAIRACAALR